MLTIRIKPKVVRKPKAPKRFTNKLVTGECRKDENGNYFVYVDLDTDDMIKPRLALPFTERSFKLKGRKNIFSREPGEHGYIRIVRDENHTKYLDGDTSKYVPFAPNWIVNGYITVLEDGSHAFDFNDIITVKGYEVSMKKSWEQ